jgi:hypothetical protein
MKPVLAFLRLNTNTSLGLFWTLVQVLLHTKRVQLTTSGSLLLLDLSGRSHVYMYMH